MAVKASPADDWKELLDVIDPTDIRGDRVIARRTRYCVHREGLLHRSVHVCVLQVPRNWDSSRSSIRDTEYKVLLQQRSEHKAIAPGCWDLSCAEHVRTGEHFEEAARRGLWEELGFEVSTSNPNGSLVPLDHGRPALQLYDYPQVGMTDYEWNRIYALLIPGSEEEPGLDLASLHLEETEVTKVRWITRNALQTELDREPNRFTPWFRDQARKHLLPERSSRSEATGIGPHSCC